MEKQFEEGEFSHKESDEINSLILYRAGEIAEKLTELECRLSNIICYVEEDENGTIVRSYTDEAQDIFNIYYDEHVTELYDLLNAQLKLIEN